MGAVQDGMTAFLEVLFNLASAVGLPYYAVAIILFTVIIKVLLYPLTWKQMSSMRRMAEIQPKMQEIQQKYKNDRQKMNEKVMDLYQKENVSPYAGCLPILVQLPVLWVFYRTLMDFPYGQDESAYFFGFNLTETYGFALNYHLILPLLAGLTTYGMSKISMSMSKSSVTSLAAEDGKGKSKKPSEALPNQVERTQKMMLTIMPVFLAYIVATLPSGMGVYIITMNIVSLLQSIYINKKLQREAEQKKQRDIAREEARVLAEKEEKEEKEKLRGKDLKKKKKEESRNT